MSSVVSVKKLRKQYKNFTAVDDISFSVERGEIFGLLGPNGAGKTTTIRIMLGLTRATGGECLLFGEPVSSANGALFGRLGVVFESGTLYEKLSGRANLQFYARLYGISSRIAEDMLRRFDLEEASAKPVSTYSRGMKQRLLIGRAMMHQPELLILDEPTSGLDPQSASFLRAIIKQFVEKGGTVVICTHYMMEAEELCDHVAFMKSGSIIVQDRPGVLQQKFGSPQIRIRIRCTGSLPDELIPHVHGKLSQRKEETAELILSSKDPRLGDKIIELQKSCEIINVHSQEASLERIFKEVTS